MKKKISQKNIYVIVGIVILIAGFYWYELRPSLIRKDCFDVAQKEAIRLLETKSELDASYKAGANKGLYLKDDFMGIYKICLNSKGLE